MEAQGCIESQIVNRVTVAVVVTVRFRVGARGAAGPFSRARLFTI